MILLTLSLQLSASSTSPPLNLSIPALWSSEGSHNTHIVGITKEKRVQLLMGGWEMICPYYSNAVLSTLIIILHGSSSFRFHFKYLNSVFVFLQMDLGVSLNCFPSQII